MSLKGVIYGKEDDNITTTLPETPVVVGELGGGEVDIPPSTHLSSEIWNSQRKEEYYCCIIWHDPTTPF